MASQPSCPSDLRTAALCSYECQEPSVVSGPPATRTSHIAQLITKFIQHQTKVSRRHDKMLQARTRLAHEQQRLRDLGRFELESRSDHLRASDALADDPTSEEARNELRKFHAQCTQDFDNFAAQSAIVLELQSELNNQQYRLDAEQASLAEVLSNLERTLCISSDSIDHAEAEVQPSEDASSSCPSILERYYDRKGDAGVRIERLQELEDEYLETLERRELLQDQGLEPATSDEALRKAFGTRQQMILRELQEAERDAERLEQEIIAAGISIDPKRPPSAAKVETVSSSMQAEETLGIVKLIPPAARLDTLQRNESSMVLASTTRLYASESSADEQRPQLRNVHNSISTWLEGVLSRPQSPSARDNSGISKVQDVTSPTKKLQTYSVMAGENKSRSKSLPDISAISSQPRRTRSTPHLEAVFRQLQSPQFASIAPQTLSADVLTPCASSGVHMFEGDSMIPRL